MPRHREQVLLFGIRSHVVHTGVCCWWAYYQKFRHMWIPSGPWAYRTASQTLFRGSADKNQFQGLQLGPQTVRLLSGIYMGCVCVVSHVQLFATPWTVAHQAPLSMEFSRQEYWNGLQFPPPRDLPNPGIKPKSQICISRVFCIGRQALYCCTAQESP